MKVRSVWCVLLSIVLATCVLGGVAFAQPEGEITFGAAADIVTMNPLKACDSYSLYAVNLIYDPLFTLNHAAEPEGQLVVEVENPEDTVYVFRLRPQVFFHDGEPFTAEDVKFTYDYIRNKENGHKFASKFSLVESIEVVDPLTVKFTLNAPDAPFLSNLTLPISPKHIAEKDTAFLDAHPVGTGPYRFVEWNPQEHYKLTANESWWKEGEPKIKDVTVRIIAESTTRMVALQSGQIDVADHIPSGMLEDLKKSGMVIIPTLPNGYNFFMFNQSVKPFEDHRVREALTLALDREGITEFIWFGLNDLVNSPIIASSWAYEKDVVNYPYDPKRAKALLAEAGYPDGLTFELLFEADEGVKRWVEAAKQMWSQVGIKVNLVSKEWGAFFSDVRKGEYQVAAFQWVGQYDPDSGLYRQFHSSNMAPNGYNFLFYSNPELDELLYKGRTCLNKEQRADYYRKAQRIITEDCLYLYLGDYRKILATRPEVKNFSYSPYAYLRDITKTTVER